MDYKIDAIEERDYQMLNDLFLEFARFENMEHRMTNTVEQMRRESEYINGFVAKDESGNIVGYATYFYTYHTFVGRCLYMDDLYICAEQRGKGLGSELIIRVITFAREQQCARMRWQVSNWNEPAIQFYKSMGAEMDGIEMNCDLILDSNTDRQS